MFTSFCVSGLSHVWLVKKAREDSYDTISLEEIPGFDSMIPESVYHINDNQEPKTRAFDVIFKNSDLLSMIRNILTDRQFEIFELRYMYGKTQIEIAQILGISQPSVKIYLNRSFKKLRKSLGGIEALLSMSDGI